jgi:hypothetical protein
MFRIANASRGDLADASVRVIFSWLDGEGPDRGRRFETLDLERRHITFFPMHWTVVHAMDETSPCMVGMPLAFMMPTQSFSSTSRRRLRSTRRRCGRGPHTCPRK